METELILVRHGETEWNKSLRFQGQQDIGLNEVGLEQADKVSNFLARWEIDLVYSSDLKRAYSTAIKIAEPHGFEVKKSPGLREMNFGSWEGLSYKDIRARYPDIVEKWFDDPTSTHPPGGEWVKEFQKRIVKTVEGILAESKGKRIVIVTHGGPIRVYLANLLGMPVRLYWRLEVDNCSVSIVKFYENNPVLKLLNSTGHLCDHF